LLRFRRGSLAGTEKRRRRVGTLPPKKKKHKAQIKMGWTRQPAKRSLVTHVNNESGRREKEQGTRLHTAKQKKKRRANVRRRASNQAHTSTHTRSKRALSPLLFSFPFLSLVVTSEWAENEEYTNNNEGRAKGGQKKKKESNERRGKERKWDP
jgi:hypothetical protein